MEVALVGSSGTTTDSFVPDRFGTDLAGALLDLGHGVHVADHLDSRLNTFDVVHVVGGRPPVDSGVDNVVVTMHSPLGDAASGDVGFDGSATLVAVSEAQVRFSRHKIPVVHYGVDIDRLRPAQTKAEETLVFTGDLTPDGGAHLAIQAALEARRPLLLLTSKKSVVDLDYLERYVEPKLGEQIVLEMEAGNERRLAAIRSASALVYAPLDPRPFDVELLESLALGTPVVGLRNGAVPEVIVDGRTGFHCLSELDLAEACRRTDELDRAECRNSAVLRFSAQRMAARYVDIYEAVSSVDLRSMAFDGTAVRKLRG